MSQLTRPATLVNRGTATVKPDPSSSRALTHTEYKEFQEQIAAFIAKFGVDRIKAMVNRRPEPNPTGRPKKWDYVKLFSLWCIVQSFVQNTQDQDQIEKIRNSCRLIKQHGGISGLDIHFHEGQSFRGVATVERWRRLYYEAEEKFSQYEMEYKEAITLSREQHPPLKERLRMHVEDNVGCWSHRSGP